MATYELSVQDNSQDDDGNVHATIAVSFDNPRYQGAQTEEYTFVDEDGEEQTGTREVESTEPETLTFEQEILVPEDHAKQQKVAEKYAADYEKQYIANQE